MRGIAPIRVNRGSAWGATGLNCSLGGRLCNHKKTRHLNPPDANVCGQCGSTALTDAANYVPLSWLGRLVFWGCLLGTAWLFGMPFLQRIGDEVGITHYRDPRVWLIESLARVLMPCAIVFWVFYGIACFVPGEAGKLLRNGMMGSVKWVVQAGLKALGSLGKAVGKLMTSLFQSRKAKT